MKKHICILLMIYSVLTEFKNNKLLNDIVKDDNTIKGDCDNLNGGEYSIELIENDPGEITDAVFEMENKLLKKWLHKPEDIIFQKEFFRIFKSWKNYSKFHDFNY